MTIQSDTKQKRLTTETIIYTKCTKHVNKYYFYIFIFVLITGWNDKIIILKKTTLQLYFKTFIEKINSANLIM